MSAWTLQGLPPEAGAQWQAAARDAQGAALTLSLSGGGSLFALRRRGMSVAARATLSLWGAEQAAEAARLWRALAEDPRERFSELGVVGGIPIYALRKPPFEGEPETGIFGVNGGGAMGLTPCVSFALPREGWAKMALLGEALANGMPAEATRQGKRGLPEAPLRSLVESLELILSVSEPGPSRARPGL